MHADGLVHEGVQICVDGVRHRISFKDMTGKVVMVYGQTEITKDLMDGRASIGAPTIYAAHDVRPHEVSSGKPRVSYRTDSKVHVKPRFRLREENTACETDQALMRDEENRREGKACGGMLGIETRTYRRCKITDDGFRDAIKPQRDGPTAQTVLRETYRHAEEQPRRRIAAARVHGNKLPAA